MHYLRFNKIENKNKVHLKNTFTHVVSCYTIEHWVKVLILTSQSINSHNQEKFWQTQKHNQCCLWRNTLWSYYSDWTVVIDTDSQQCHGKIKFQLLENQSHFSQYPIPGIIMMIFFFILMIIWRVGWWNVTLPRHKHKLQRARSRMSGTGMTGCIMSWNFDQNFVQVVLNL